MNRDLKDISTGFVRRFRTETLSNWLTTSFCYAEGCADMLDYQGIALVSGQARPLVSQAHAISVLALSLEQQWQTQPCQAGIERLLRDVAKFGVASNRADGYLHCFPAAPISDKPVYVLTDHTQMITASCHTYQALGSFTNIRRAVNIVKWLDRRFAAPHGGWYERSDEIDWRSSSAHISMFDALLNMALCTGKASWLARCEAVVQVFKRHFFQDNPPAVFTHLRLDYALPESSCVNTDPSHLVSWLRVLLRFKQQKGQVDPDLDHKIATLEACVVRRVSQWQQGAIRYAVPDQLAEFTALVQVGGFLIAGTGQGAQWCEIVAWVLEQIMQQATTASYPNHGMTVAELQGLCQAAITAHQWAGNL